MSYYKDKVVWVTGASSGIGLAYASFVNKLGAKVILSARRKEVLEEVKNNFTHPENAYVLPLDLEDYSNVNEITLEAINAFGRVDILINNGGLSQRANVLDTEMKVVEKLMKVNFLGTVALTKAILPHMIKNKSGQIAVVSSVVGKFGTPRRSSYAATKHALHGYFDALRAEMFEHGIDVTIICPGYVTTNISKNALTADGSAQNKMDNATEKGIDPIVFADRMASAIAQKKEEVYITGAKERFGLFMKRFFPSIFSKLVRKMAVT
jgi:dehydrogenase/reductase SDR family protein 7B